MVFLKEQVGKDYTPELKFYLELLIWELLLVFLIFLMNTAYLLN
jgi:hypothetical protein